MEGVNRLAGSGWKTLVDRDRLRDAIQKGLPRLRDAFRGTACAMPFEDNSLSTAACTSVDIFAIVHELLDRVDSCARHSDKVFDLTQFASITNKCRNIHSTVSLRSHFEVPNNINNSTPYSFMLQSQSIGWVKQKTDNNCQTTRIVTKSFVQFFLAPPGNCYSGNKMWIYSIIV